MQVPNEIIKIISLSIFLLMLSNVSFAQMKVSGYVLGENHVTLFRASVLVKGTPVDTITDSSGLFKISLSIMAN